MKGSMQTHQIIYLQPAAPLKPPEGAPCNGCGVCCLAEPCPLGILLSGKRVGACSALRWDERQQLYRCGALTDPVGVLPRGLRWLAAALRRLARRWIAAGIGCDAALSVHVPPKR
jgi:hypothetical protein